MGFVDSESESEAETSLLVNGNEEAPHVKSNGRIPSPILKTPSARSSELYGSTKSRRKLVTTEAEEILEELEDDTLPGLFSPAVSHHRRSSARSSTRSKGNRNDVQQPNESTALLGRTGTGRSYRDRRRRRRSELSVTGRRGSADTPPEWWKMRWWRGKDGKGRDDRDEARDR